MPTENDELLQGLSALGCGVQQHEGATFVSLPDNFAEFVLDRQGEWLYLGTTFLNPEEFESSDYSGRLDRFLLELQDRSLGCHFSYDRNGYLMIGTEIHLQQQTAKGILQAMEQIAFVIEVCIHFCDRVLEGNPIPADAELDEAFGAVGGRLH